MTSAIYFLSFTSIQHRLSLVFKPPVRLFPQGEKIDRSVRCRAALEKLTKS
jgi:hypothetical protein